MQSQKPLDFLGPPANIDFSATSWTLVHLAGLKDVNAQQAALTQLLTRYLPPLRSHLVQRKRIDAHKADDLLQDFVADKVLASGIIERAARERGKFRTFLLVALDRFVSNRLRDERAAKHSPTEGFSGTSIEDAGDIPGVDDEPSRAFSINWARAILDETMFRMQTYCRISNRVILWEIFHDRVVSPCLLDKSPTPYAVLTARFGFQSPAEAGNLVLTGRRMFARLLHDVIAEYARDEEDIEEEIADLRRTVSGSE